MGANMNDHPSLGRILDRVLDQAPVERDTAREDADGGGSQRAGPGGGEWNDLRTHLAGCEPCQETERWARKLVEAIAHGPHREAPKSLVDRALGIPGEEPRAVLEAGGWSLARLVEDAFARPALAGVRGAAAGRRMLFELEGGHVDVEIGPSADDGEQLKLRGQVIFEDRRPPDDLLALLWSERRTIARATGDAAGGFVFSRVPPGLYRLDLLSLSAQRAVRIAEITVEVEEP